MSGACQASLTEAGEVFADLMSRQLSTTAGARPRASRLLVAPLPALAAAAADTSDASDDAHEELDCSSVFTDAAVSPAASPHHSAASEVSLQRHLDGGPSDDAPCASPRVRLDPATMLPHKDTPDPLQHDDAPHTSPTPPPPSYALGAASSSRGRLESGLASLLAAAEDRAREQERAFAEVFDDADV